MLIAGDTDAALVARCCDGDARAFDELVRRHRERALGQARRQVADDQGAEDVVQQAFLYAYASLPALREGGKFGGWLATVISRLAIRYRRENERAQAHFLSGLIDDERLLATLPARDEAAEDLQARVQAILAELTRQHREVLELFHLGGLSCQEVANQLGEPLGTIKRRLHDSRRRFQREWTKMAATARGGVGRRMRVWIAGRIHNEASPLMSTLLAQTIALTIHKRSFTAAQIAEKVGADREYVDDVLSRMVRLELATKQRERYLLNFIALDREDYAELLRQAQETGKALAQCLATVMPKVQAAYEGTAMAGRGWTWEQVHATVVLAVVYNAGVARSVPEVTRGRQYHELPLRPDGERWNLGGIELGEASMPLLPDCRMRGLSGGGTGFVRWPGLTAAGAAHLRQDSFPLLRSLAEDNKALTEILAGTKGPGEECRAALVRLLEQGLGRRKGSRFELLFPVFQQPDLEALLPVVDKVVAPAAREVLVPRAQEADALLRRLGHGRLADQAVWMRESLFGYEVRGWTTLYLSELGAVRRPPTTPPPHWGYFGWLGDGGGVFCTRG